VSISISGTPDEACARHVLSGARRVLLVILTVAEPDATAVAVISYRHNTQRRAIPISAALALAASGTPLMVHRHTRDAQRIP
jgi:hypothetical protein